MANSKSYGIGISDDRLNGIPHPDDLREVPIHDERKVKLGSRLKKGLSFSCLYDFVDNFNRLIGGNKYRLLAHVRYNTQRL